MRKLFATKRSTEKTHDPFEQYYANENSHGESIGSTIQYAWTVEPEPTEEDSRGKRGVGKIVKKLGCGSGIRDQDILDQLAEDRMNASTLSWEPSEQGDGDWNAGGKFQRLRTSCASRENGYARIGSARPEPYIGKTRFVPQIEVDLPVVSDHQHHSNNTSLCGFESERPRNHREENVESATTTTPVTTTTTTTTTTTPATTSSSLHCHSNKGEHIVGGNNKLRQLILRKEQAGKRKQFHRLLCRGSDHLTTSSGETGSYGTHPSSESDYTSESSSRDSSLFAPENCLLLLPQSSTRGCSTATQERQESALQIIWDYVAEDLGILAGFVLADGKACVGSMSEIAQETAMEPCTTTRSSNSSTRSSARRSSSSRRRHRIPDSAEYDE